MTSRQLPDAILIAQFHVSDAELEFQQALSFGRIAMLRKVVDRVRQFRRSEGFKHSVAAPVRLKLHARQRLNKSVFAIEIQENSGFFSVMQMVLFILMH